MSSPLIGQGEQSAYLFNRKAEIARATQENQSTDMLHGIDPVVAPGCR